MGILYESVHYIHRNEKDIFETNPDLEWLNIHEEIAELGQAALFLQNNLFECIDVFGPSVVTYLIEDLKHDFDILLSESIIPKKFHKTDTGTKSIVPTNLHKDYVENKPHPTVNSHSIVPDVNHPHSILDVIKDHSTEIGWTVLAAIAIAGAYKIYKNYFSKAAQYCKGKTGDEKQACITNYQNKAYQMKIKTLKKSLDLSNKTKNPSKYREKIQSEIKKIQKKIKK